MPIRVQTPDGVMEFPDDTTIEEIDQILGAAPPEPDEPERTWTDTAVDALPLIGGAIGGIVGAPTGPGAVGTAALGAAGGEGFRQTINALRGKPIPPLAERVGGMAMQGGAAALGEGVGQVAVKGIQAAARPLMRGAMGAQTALRRKFPTVDLEAVALREGVGLPGVNVPEKALAANRAVAASGRAADAAGAAPVQPREMVAGLRPLMDRAKQTRDTAQQQQIIEAANDIRKRFRGGIGVEDSLATKSDMASQAKSVMQGAADPRSAATSKKVLGAVSRSTGDAAKSRSGDVRNALSRSQEMMALDKAVQAMSSPSRLRLLIGGATGVGSGVSSGDPLKGLTGAASAYALTSPRALSLLAQLMAKGAPASRHGVRGLAQLMSSHEEQ